MTEKQLIEQAGQGNLDSLEKLLIRNHAELTHHIESRLGKRLRDGGCTAADVVQETLFRAFRDFASFRQDGSFAGWLKRIGDRCILDLARAQNRKKRGGGRKEIRIVDDSQNGHQTLAAMMTTAETPSQNAAKKEAIDGVQDAIASLPIDQRTAIQLRYFDKLPVNEVAKEMKRSKTATGGLLHRALKSMRATLQRSSKWFGKG